MEYIINKRPKLLSIVCVLGFIWIVFSFPAVFSPSMKKLGSWYPAILGLIVAANFISLIGVWHMKRWGVHLFVISFFTKEILQVLINDLNYFGITASIIFIVIMLLFYKRMDLNL